MFRFSKTVLVLAIFSVSTAAIAFENFKGVGRPATAAEVKAWDIAVRPDFKGLPKGSGTVDRGQELFEEKCASCHGTFGESNEVFTPLVGGTSKEDSKTGRVAALATGELPQRTTFTKVATISTVFDYIQRAMPWTAPKSLKPDEVYTILAYMLNLAELVPADFKLSDQNIGEVQKLLPNRNGMTTEHGMWPGAPAKKGGIGNGGIPDVKNTACMKNCKSEVRIGSTLPDYARNAHGNLADQNRSFGAVRGSRPVSPCRRARPSRLLRHPNSIWPPRAAAWPATASRSRSSVPATTRSSSVTRTNRMPPIAWRGGQGRRAGRLGLGTDVTQRPAEG